MYTKEKNLVSLAITKKINDGTIMWYRTEGAMKL